MQNIAEQETALSKSELWLQVSRRKGNPGLNLLVPLRRRHLVVRAAEVPAGEIECDSSHFQPLTSEFANLPRSHKNDSYLRRHFAGRFANHRKRRLSPGDPFRTKETSILSLPGAPQKGRACSSRLADELAEEFR